MSEDIVDRLRQRASEFAVQIEANDYGNISASPQAIVRLRDNMALCLDAAAAIKASDVEWQQTCDYIRNSAIEECARVAESYEEAEFGYNPTAVKIAAAIRALKDKP